MERIVGVDNLHSEGDRDTQSKALNHLKLVASFDLIVALVMTRNIFDLTIDVTQLLQARNNDIFDAIHLINTLKLNFLKLGVT